MNEQQNKPFKIKLHPLMDEKTLNAISDATLEAIDGQLYKQPALTPDDIGKDIKGEGIYLGTYAPVDRDGVSLKKVFNVFAAPEDLFVEKKKPFYFLRKVFKMATTDRIETFTYIDTVKKVKNLKNWHGHNGTNYATDKELCAALKGGTYNGGWIIPTRYILCGRDENGKETTPDNIINLARKDSSFKGTFKFDCPGNWYWSSSETPHSNSMSCFDVRLSYGYVSWYHKKKRRLSCRPVRLVPI